MKNANSLKSVALLVSFLFVALVFSCTKEGSGISSDIEYSTDNEHIKSISMNGVIVNNYLYDVSGRIVEDNSEFSCSRYFYDTNGRLIKVESAVDINGLLSSLYYPGKKELMTFKNSSPTSYSLYRYDLHGLLSKIENYFKGTNIQFEYGSMRTFEYEGSIIVKVNWHDLAGKVTQFYEYACDDRGNVANEKYYRCIDGSEPELMYESSYKYDKFKNPFQIFSQAGSPGSCMNVNNIIETNHTNTYTLGVPGVYSYSNSTTTYEYNKDGYPAKIIGEGEVIYKY
jgi:hypothetical protein